MTDMTRASNLTGAEHQYWRAVNQPYFPYGISDKRWFQLRKRMLRSVGWVPPKPAQLPPYI